MIMPPSQEPPHPPKLPTVSSFFRRLLGIASTIFFLYGYCYLEALFVHWIFSVFDPSPPNHRSIRGEVLTWTFESAALQTTTDD